MQSLLANDVPRVAFVLWNGTLGGAETFTSYLVAELRDCGVDAQVVFVEAPEPLAARLDDLAVPWTAMNLSRGRTILRKPRQYAQVLRTHGADGAVLMSSRYLATALRIGGYRGRIVAVEHGDMLIDRHRGWPSKQLRALDRRISIRSIDIEVGVSSFMLAEMQHRHHAPDLRRIPYGIDIDRFQPTQPLNLRDPLRIGWAGRMIPGKGADYLLHAARLLADSEHEVRLRIAGDGPIRVELQALSERLDLADRVEFLGSVQDMPDYWNSCDVAIASSAEFVESFGMTPLEAAACGRPAVVAGRGGLVETVMEGQTGLIVPPGDPKLLAGAITRYAGDRQLLTIHGRAARDRAVREFSMKRCASEYLTAIT